MMTQSIKPQPLSYMYPEEVMVREVINQEDEAAKLKKHLQRKLGKKLSNLLNDAKKLKLGGVSSFRLDKQKNSIQDGQISKGSVFRTGSQNSSGHMLGTEVSIASDINNLVKNKSIKKSVKQVQIEGYNLSQYNINQDSQVNMLDNQSAIELQTQNFQGTLLNLAKRTPTIGTRDSTRLAYPKKTKFEGSGMDSHGFNPQNKITLNTAQEFNKRKLSVQRPRQLAPIQKVIPRDKSKFSSQRVSPNSQTTFRRNSPDNTNGQWSQNLQFKFNRQQPTLKRIRLEQDDNQSFGVINFKDEIESCWEATHFSKKEIRQKRNKSNLGGYSNKNQFPFLIETGNIEEQVKFKAPYTKSINLYQYEEDLNIWDNMTSQQFTKMTENSISALEINEIKNADKSNNTTSRREVTVGATHIVSEHSEEETPFPAQNKLKLQIMNSKQMMANLQPQIMQKQPYTQSIQKSPAKSPNKYDESPGSGDYTVDSLGEKKLRKLLRNDSSLEREKYDQMVNVVNHRIKQREKGQVEFKNAIQKVKKKDVGFDLDYLDDKINKSLMSTAPKFIYVKYQSTLPPQVDKKVQSKINMGSKTKGNKKRKKINFMARNTQMYSSNLLPTTKDQEYKKGKTAGVSQLENQSN